MVHFRQWLSSLSFFIAVVALADGPRCDQLASVVADPERQAPGVAYGDISGPEVIRFCRAAIEEDPSNGRYWLQLGRGFLKQDRGAEMIDAFRRSRILGYPAAIFALAVVYHTGNGLSESSSQDAEHLYKEAYKKGIGYAALGLARLYDEKESPFFDPDKAFLWQERFDSFQTQH